MQSTKVFFQRKQKSNNRLYIGGCQKIDVGLNDLGTKVLLSSKINIIWNWPKAFWLNWLASPSFSI